MTDPKTRVNAYAGTCSCGKNVAPGEGEVWMDANFRWQVRHPDCTGKAALNRLLSAMRQA